MTPSFASASGTNRPWKWQRTWRATGRAPAASDGVADAGDTGFTVDMGPRAPCGSRGGIGPSRAGPSIAAAPLAPGRARRPDDPGQARQDQPAVGDVEETAPDQA